MKKLLTALVQALVFRNKNLLLQPTISKVQKASLRDSFSTSCKMALALLGLSCLAAHPARAQTQLSAGDLSFLGFNSALSNRDGFSFVTWKALASGTVIKFSDNGFNSTNTAATAGNLREQEQTITWTATTAIAAGTTITIEANGATTPTTVTNYGTVAITNANGAATSTILLTNGGDQIVAFQGNYSPGNSLTGTLSGTALFIFSYQGISSTYTTWLASGTTGSGTTYLPSDLSSYSFFLASNAVAGEYTGPRSGKTTDEYKALVKDPANWTIYLNPNGVATYNTTAFNAGSTLPLTLTSFTASSFNGNNLLRWQTAGEENTGFFHIEKSNDGRAFATIGTIKAAGHSTTERSYEYTDAHPLPATSYYRLKTIDRNGAESYSNVVILKTSGKKGMAVFPNPAVNTINVQWTGPGNRLELQDIAGRVVKTILLSPTGTASTSIDISSLKKGVYFLKAGSESVQFVKQ